MSVQQPWPPQTEMEMQADSGTWAFNARRYLSNSYGKILFALTFVLPTLIAILFYLLIASDRYISETTFIVRSVDKPAAEGVAAYLQDFGILRANDDAFAIQDFIHSRDAMNALMKDVDLRKIYSSREADYFTRYNRQGSNDTKEAFFKYFKRQVQVDKDQETGITRVRVSAYRAPDAKRIAELILSLSEARVNEMNERAHVDALRLAQDNVRSASAAFVSANVALGEYRNASGTVDPEESAGAATERGSALDMELANMRANLRVMQAKAPAHPAIGAIRQRIAALEEQSRLQAGELTGRSSSLSQKVGSFERLLVERELAAKTYEAAEKQLEHAQEEAERQQIYIETVSRPSIPDEPLEPRRWRYIFTVALLGFWTFLILYLLVAGSREHLNLS
jgi:capsular polysaccharide transport system permease protein